MYISPVKFSDNRAILADNRSIRVNRGTFVREADSVSFSGGIRFKEYNPAYRFCMKLFERSIVASRRRFSPPIDALRGKLDEVKIPLNSQKSILAYDINPDNADKYVVFFHGSSQNITNSQTLYKEILEAKYAVLAPEYSGFGKNKPIAANELTLDADIKATIEYIRKKNIKPENLGIIGHSLGSYAAMKTAEQIPEAKFVILVSPVNSLIFEMENILKHRKFKIPKIFQFLCKSCPGLLNPLEKVFRTEERIAASKIPLYIIHSANDNLIPVKSSKALAMHSKYLMELSILKDGGHRLDKAKLMPVRGILDKLQ